MRADAWDASLLTLPEHQCKPHPVAYGFRGPSNMRIQQEVDRQTQRVVKITIYIQWMQQYREIWMDGRPHPPEYAPHTWQGFSTGRWEGDTLVVDITNYSGQGMIATSAATGRIRGVPESADLHVVERFTRTGPETIKYEVTIEDPKAYTKPWKVSIPLEKQSDYTLYEYACHEGNIALADILRGGRLADAASH